MIARVRYGAPSPDPLFSRLLAWALLVVVAGFVLLSQPGCSPTARRVVSGAIVAAGSAVADLDQANRDLYTAQTDALRESVKARGGSLADYDRGVAPLDAEFDARVLAVEAIDTALYAAAGILDAADDTSPAVAEAARTVSAQLARAVDVLESGDALPPVPLPASVRAVMVQLSQLVHADDAGGG